MDRIKMTIMLKIGEKSVFLVGGFFFAGLLMHKPVVAFELYESDSVSVALDSAVSWGMQFRVQDRDEELVGPPGGTYPGVNSDDGDLNFDKGVVSNAAKITSELEVRSDNWGAFARATAFYGYELVQNDRERTPLTDEAKDEAGSKIDLLDANVWASHDIGSLPSSLRVGRQVVSWGESLFIGIIIITGKADSPVYISLINGTAEIRNASVLWGKDSYETQRLIKEELPNDKVSVACIGRAGEQLIPYAGVMNDEGRTAGRCGMGALMGSKNLKAVAVSGNRRATPADKGEVAQLAKQAVEGINGDMNAVLLREYGSNGYMEIGMVLRDTPTKYFTKNVFPSRELSGQTLRQKYTVKNYACMGCPIGCGRTLKDFKPGLDVDGPEYVTVAAFGPLCMNTDFDSIIEANHLCNVHGLDTISAGVSIAYAFYLVEKGVLTKDQIGFEPKWGDGKAVLKLLEMIIEQEGIGVLLSKCVRAMAKEFEREEGEAAHVKGLKMPMHDGRAFHGQVLSYATGPRGACHLKGEYYGVELGGAVLEYDILPGDRLSSHSKGESVAKHQSLRYLFDSLTLCKFAPLQVLQICAILNAQTGWDFGPEELLQAGNRSITIKRAISNKLGLTREQDTMPKIRLEPLDEGTTAGIKPDIDMMLKEYYQYREWDWESGKPTRENLVALGLDQVVEEMYPTA